MYDSAVRHVRVSYKFTGKERDSESGLDNFGARFDASSLGRFTSPDPENDSGFENQDDPQSWNGYSYVRNNPLNLTDPDGRSYDVCINNGNGGQNCVHYKYDSSFESSAAKSGATLEGGQILVNREQIGTYKHTVDAGVENGGSTEDTILAPVLVGGIIGGVKAGIRGIGEGVVGGGARAGAEDAVTTAVSDAASQSALRAGGIIERTIQTAAGPVKIYAEVTTEGSTAVVDLAIYPAESEGAINAGYTAMRQGLRPILKELKDAGFSQARIQAKRLGGANAGRSMTLNITLK